MSRIKDPASDAAAAAHGVGEKLGETAQQVSQNIRDIGGQVRDAAADKYNQLREQAGEYYEQGQKNVKQWEQSLENYVQEKPLQSVLIAAGVGLLLGILWKRS